MDLTCLTKPLTQPPILTIVGTPGVGKTTLAALFPNAVIIRAEDGGAVFDSWADDAKPMLFPVLPRAKVDKDGKLTVSTKETLLDQLRALISQEHTFKTLIIDAVSSLDALLQYEVTIGYGVDNIGEAAGGYGKGYLVSKGYHAEIKAACDILRDKKGMTIIFLSHSKIIKIKNRPDADEYTLFTLDLHEASIPTYTNLVDAVLYLRQDEFVKGVQVDKKGVTTKFGKMVQTGDRILVTSGDGKIGFANSKNRFDFEAEIPVAKGENPLLGLIPYYINQTKA